MTEIILIEDDPYDAELILLAFKENGINKQTHWIKNGNEAIDYLLDLEKNKIIYKKYIKLIILDLKLAKINGFDILKTIKNTESLKNIPVVILTSSDLDSDIKNGYDFGVNSYIQKPTDFNKMVEIINQIALYWLMINRTINNE